MSRSPFLYQTTELNYLLPSGFKRARYIVQLQWFNQTTFTSVEFLLVVISFVLLFKLSVSIYVGNLELKNDLN